MRSQYVFEDVIELTTPIRLKSGAEGYVAGRCWNVRRGVEEYDVMVDGHQIVRSLTAHEFVITGQPRQDLVRAA